MSFKAPSKGIVFWPIGTGDSTTVFINEETVFQVDLNHLRKSEENNEPHWMIIDSLEEVLPKKNSKPFLSVFALTHADQDHCRGFAELLDRVTIGELWFTPRVFTEYKNDLCDDAVAFQKEAMRRVKKVIKDKDVDSGDKVRIIGFDDILKKPEYENFPQEFFSVPGHEVTCLDGMDLEGEFRAFIHSPFKEELQGDRNDTSLGMQIQVSEGDNEFYALLFGDLKYPSLMKVFENTNDKQNLKWNILLAPHHCSKSVMFIRSDDGDDEYKSDIMELFDNHQEDEGFIISSSMPFEQKDKIGENPPHKKARKKYETIVKGDFMCTHEHPNEEKPEPIVFELSDTEFTYVGPGSKSGSTLKGGVASARGSDAPPNERVGYGEFNCY